MEHVDGTTFRTATGTAPLPFTLAVGASLILHVGFFYALPATMARSEPTADTIVVELPPSSESQSVPAPAPPLSELTPDVTTSSVPTTPHSPGKPPELKVEQQTAQPAVPTSHVAEASASSARPSAIPARPNDTSNVPKTEGTAVPARTPILAAPPQKRTTKSLSDLMPSPRDLAAFRSKKVPDPAGGSAREASLGLGETDARYQGYLDQVKAGVFGSWHVGRGLLVSGGDRRVVVRFTLTSLGLVESAQLVSGSGNPTLDTEALEALRRAQLAPFPTHWTIERLTLVAEFDYSFR